MGLDFGEVCFKVVDSKDNQGNSPVKVGHKVDQRVTIFIQYNNSNYSLIVDPNSNVENLRNQIIE